LNKRAGLKARERSLSMCWAQSQCKKLEQEAGARGWSKKLKQGARVRS